MLDEFENNNDKLRVTRVGPWHFDKCLTLIKDFDGMQQVKNICMKEATFWVRVYDLPLMAWNAYVGREVGAALGSV